MQRLSSEFGSAPSPSVLSMSCTSSPDLQRAMISWSASTGRDATNGSSLRYRNLSGSGTAAECSFAIASRALRDETVARYEYKPYTASAEPLAATLVSTCIAPCTGQCRAPAWSNYFLAAELSRVLRYHAFFFSRARM